MIQKLLLSTGIIWMIFVKILKNTIQIKNEKIWLFLLTWLVICNNNVKLYKILNALFIRETKLNISIVFITQLYFKVPKDVRLNTTYFLLWKFQIKENLNKLRIIIHEMLSLKTSWILQKRYCKTIYFLSC